jgi:hypothetical protein
MCCGCSRNVKVWALFTHTQDLPYWLSVFSSSDRTSGVAIVILLRIRYVSALPFQFSSVCPAECWNDIRWSSCKSSWCYTWSFSCLILPHVIYQVETASWNNLRIHQSPLQLFIYNQPRLMVTFLPPPLDHLCFFFVVKGPAADPTDAPQS